MEDQGARHPGHGLVGYPAHDDSSLPDMGDHLHDEPCRRGAQPDVRHVRDGVQVLAIRDGRGESCGADTDRGHTGASEEENRAMSKTWMGAIAAIACTFAMEFSPNEPYLAYLLFRLIVLGIFVLIIRRIDKKV